MAVNFIRKAELLLANDTEGLVISDLRVVFRVEAADTETLNSATITVFNLSDATMKRATQEYSKVVLQAGYEDGNFGIIFQGTLKYFRQGKIDNVNTFLEINAADSDIIYNYGVVNNTVDVPCDYTKLYNAAIQSLGAPKDPNSEIVLSDQGGFIPRGKVQFGLGRKVLRGIAGNTNTRFSFQGGVAIMLPVTGYLDGEVVEINSTTGMIGIPTATDNGIEVECELNPLIQIGGRIKINNSDINQTTIRDIFFKNYSTIQYTASLARDGIYRVMVAEHSGDTRGLEWVTHIVCMAIDPSAPPSDSVSAI